MSELVSRPKRDTDGETCARQNGKCQASVRQVSHLGKTWVYRKAWVMRMYYIYIYIYIYIRGFRTSSEGVPSTSMMSRSWWR